MLALRDVQARFFRSIAAAPGPAASEGFDPALVDLVEARGRLGPADRLDVYAQMYWARLHDVLGEDFPRVASLLGPERFADAACAYLARHPSTCPSVRHVGRGFADFLAAAPEAAGMPFLADLARLEWARLEVFDAPDAEPLGVEDLRQVAPADWPRLTLRLVPAVVLLRSAWRIHDLWAAVEKDGPDATARRERTDLRVWRSGFVVYHASTDAAERLALGRVARGEPFAAVCAALERTMRPEEAVSEAAELVLRWVEDGILARA